MKGPNDRALFIILLSGILIRLLCMPFFLHVDPKMGGDLIATNRAAVLFLQNPGQVKSPYPPLALAVIGVYQWAWNGLDNNPFVVPLDQRINLIDSPDIFRLLFTSKTLFLIFDLFSVFVIYKLFQEDPGKQKRAIAFWVFNPLIIWNGYIHGQYDLLPVFFILLMLYWGKKGSALLAMLSLSIAASLKNFPFLFLLPSCLILAQTWRKRGLLLLVGLVPYVLLFVPFSLSSAYLKNSGDFFSPFFQSGYDLGRGDFVYIFFVLYGLLIWFLIEKKGTSFSDLWRSGLLVLLLYFQFSPFDLHYWVWLVPFALFFWIEKPERAKLFFLIALCELAVLILPTPFLRFASPVSPAAFLPIPSFLELLSPYFPALFFVNIVRSLLAGTCLYLAFTLAMDMYRASAAANQ